MLFVILTISSVFASGDTCSSMTIDYPTSEGAGYHSYYVTKDYDDRDGLYEKWMNGIAKSEENCEEDLGEQYNELVLDCHNYCSSEGCGMIFTPRQETLTCEAGLPKIYDVGPGWRYHFKATGSFNGVCKCIEVSPTDPSRLE